MAADKSYQKVVQRRQDGSLHVPSGRLIDIESGGDITFAGVSSGAALAAQAAAVGAVAFQRAIKIAKVALAAVDTGGGIFSWVNPEAVGIVVTKVDINVTTIATGACSIDVGTTAVSGTTQSDTLIDGLDVHSATGVFSTASQAGANGVPPKTLAVGAWVTGSKDSGASAGIIGAAYIHYYLT